MINKVQMALGDEYNLAERKQTTIWNGEMGEMVDATQDPFVFEFAFNEFQHPYTYRGDKVATIFMANGFVVWFRAYGQNFRLLAIPMTEGVLESSWAGYINSYWQKNGLPSDEYIYPVMKKLPCHIAIDDGYVTAETISEMFDLDWNMPDYLKAGRQYLASNCEEANRISQEKVNYWDATSMCGPLAWTIMRDANGFPYRIGSWSANANPFIKANPKGNGQPWDTFDPETFTLTRTDAPMPGYDFNSNGNLFPGDLIYSYSSFYKTENDQEFDHIFIIAGIDNNNTRLSISNMVRNQPYSDCSIEEIPLYTPGDLETGIINHEWNGFGFGQTGTSGFDIFRWDWITYHLDGNPIQYTVRWGDTAETIAFDWKVAPNLILDANRFTSGIQLIPGQIIILPAPISDNNL
ncbi:MAG TPA: LysM peptidoglycan-binding domain-containing protein, partial [Anaerolineales bacterium]|nr:LysM peptidoglycan-binding domain-containing protein [Anaerolineales bacterium]